MGTGYGMLGFFGLAHQSSYGASAQASAEFFPFISESITTTVEQLMEEGIRRRMGEPPSQVGLEQTAGDLAMEVHPLGIGHFLKAVCGVGTSTYTADSCTTHDFIPQGSDWNISEPLPPLTGLIHRGVGQTWELTDGVVNKLEFNIVGGQMLKATAGMMFKTSSLRAAPTPTFAKLDPWFWSQGSATITTTPHPHIDEMTITIDNQIEGQTNLNATKRIGRFIRTGYIMVRVAGSMVFETQSAYLDYIAGTERRLLLNFGSNVTSYNTLLFDIPKIRYETYPLAIAGPGVIKVGFSNRGVYDESSNYAVKVSLVNTRIAY